MEWQPISTAPRDEYRSLLWFPEANEAHTAYWGQNVYYPRKDWTLDGGESATLTYGDPTHWMPLPYPPETPDLHQEAK